MGPPFKRKRQSSSTQHRSSTSRIQQCTPLPSFKRPSRQTQASSPAAVSQNGPPQGSVTVTERPRSCRRNAGHSESISESQVEGVESDEDYVDESLDHIIMALDIKERGTVGCAYYIARERRLLCMEDVVGGGLDITEILKIQMQPTTVLVSLRVDPSNDASDGLHNDRQTSLVGNEGDNPYLPYQLDYRPSQEFDFEGARNKLVNLHSIFPDVPEVVFLVPGEPDICEGPAHNELASTNLQGKVLRLSACIDFDSKVSVGCVGAVLTHLQKRRNDQYLPDGPDSQQAYAVTSVEMFSLYGTMFINADTLVSLQIIQPETHPNAFNQGPGSTGSKESLSVYGLFHHYARTPQGRVGLRQMFLRPSLNLGEIIARHDFLAVFVRPDNLSATQKLSKSMSKVKNMRATMTLLHKGVSGGNQRVGGFKSGVWATLLEFAYHTIDIRDTLCEVVGAETIPLRAKAMECLNKFDLQRVGKMIHDVVDLTLSIEQHRTVVKRGINDKLDEIKDTYDGMADLLGVAAREISNTIPSILALNLNVIYFPQLGFHITVPIDERTRIPLYDGGDVPWELMFTTKSQAYFKDARMHEMDEQLGDLYTMMCDMEIEISYDLAQRVLQDEKIIVTVSDLCGELDCLLALAQGASQYKLTRPRMSEDNVISIKGGRHLLQEMTVPSYIANDAYLTGGKGEDDRERSVTNDSRTPSTSSIDANGPSMLILTGPNYSGKSVYQKQVAIIVYMAHVGSFVPAESAVIGVTDKILTRISTRETVSKIQSAFMIDLQQIALALNQTSRRSLIVIDEFGKGTNSCDGAGLLTGVLQHLLSRARNCPKVLVATHFHEIFEHGFLTPQPNLAFAHMEVLVQAVDSANNDARAKRVIRSSTPSSITPTITTSTNTEVTYLYTLKPGRSNLSYGTQCAALNGIPAPIVKRANKLATLASKGEDLVAVCAGMSVEEEEDLEDAEAAARMFLELDLMEGEEEGGSEEPGMGIRARLDWVLDGTGTAESGSVSVL